MQPKMLTIIEKLSEILKGEIARDDVASWSLQFINDDDMRIDDLKAWELLKLVGSVDLYDSPETYLYEDDDIRKWILEYSS